jgi:hypothetical protein
MMISQAISYGWGPMEPLTSIFVHLISLAAGIAMLIAARNEHLLFRTGLACAAVVFTAGVIAMSQQNMIGAGLVLAPMFMMMIVTALLPREVPSIEDNADERDPASAAEHEVQPIEPAPARLRAASARPLIGLAGYAIAAFVLAFTAEAVLHGMTPHGADAKQKLTSVRPAASHAGDLSDTIALRAGAYSDSPALADDADDGTIDDALRAPAALAAQQHGPEPKDAKECLSSSMHCNPPGETDDDGPSLAKGTPTR